MIATGTDVKPLECLLFMRDVKSRGYFEQMKGRGTRTLDLDGMRKTTPSARTAKTHYVTLTQIRDVLSAIQANAPRLAPLRVWDAYARLDELPDTAKPLTELTM